jgi:hypothetical protein
MLPFERGNCSVSGHSSTGHSIAAMVIVDAHDRGGRVLGGRGTVGRGMERGRWGGILLVREGVVTVNGEGLEGLYNNL